MAGKGRGEWWQRAAAGVEQNARFDAQYASKKVFARLFGIAEVLASPNTLEHWDTYERYDPVRAAAILPDVLRGKIPLSVVQERIKTARSMREAVGVDRTLEDIITEVIEQGPPAAMKLDPSEPAVWGDGIWGVGIVTDSIYPLANEERFGHEFALIVSPTFQCSPMFGLNYKEFMLRLGYVISIYEHSWVYCSSGYELNEVNDHAMRVGWGRNRLKVLGPR